MPDSQSREPGFEPSLLPFQSFIFVLFRRLSCINEYLAIDSGGHVHVNSRCAIAARLECFQEKPSWCRNEQVCQGRKSVKRFERSNGRDTALYIKTYLYRYFFLKSSFSIVNPSILKSTYCRPKLYRRWTVHFSE